MPIEPALLDPPSSRKARLGGPDAAGCSGASQFPKPVAWTNTKALLGVETLGALLFVYKPAVVKVGQFVPELGQRIFRRPSHGSLVVLVDLPDGPQRHLAGIHDPP